MEARQAGGYDLSVNRFTSLQIPSRAGASPCLPFVSYKIGCVAPIGKNADTEILFNSRAERVVWAPDLAADAKREGSRRWHSYLKGLGAWWAKARTILLRQEDA
jgi:hypothetical protein